MIIMIKIRVIEKKRKERDWERATMYHYSTAISKVSNVAIFTDHIFSGYILHKAKTQHYFIVFVIRRKKAELLHSQYKDIIFS